MTENTITPTAEQQCALDLIEAFLNDKTQREFRLGGYAGTGKTSILALLNCETTENIEYVSLCGKACEVLRSKGIGAKTIHSTVYGITGKGEDGKLPKFEVKDLSDVDLLVCDEASMISKKIYDDIYDSNVKKILFVGDHGQLPPIGNDSINLMEKLDYKLTKVMRQAKHNPIIKASMDVRKGRYVHQTIENSYGKVEVGRDEIKDKYLETCHNGFIDSVIITDTNKRRIRLNQGVRNVRGFVENKIYDGERIVILSNSPNQKLYNGTVFIARTPKFIGKLIVTDKQNKKQLLENVWEVMNGERKLTIRLGETGVYNRDIPIATYGYALTCHKSQGSEFDNVFANLYDGYWLDDHKKFQYTIVTRAKKSLYLLDTWTIL